MQATSSTSRHIRTIAGWWVMNRTCRSISSARNIMLQNEDPQHAGKSRTLRAGWRAYLPLGSIVAALVVLWIAIGVTRGAETGAWRVVLLLLGVYAVWVVICMGRRIVVTSSGITARYLVGSERRVSWNAVRRSQITAWLGSSPFQILIYGNDDDAPLLDIPLPLFARRDVEYLLSLQGLKIEGRET